MLTRSTLWMITALIGLNGCNPSSPLQETTSPPKLSTPTVLLVNGDIVTMNSDAPSAQAMAYSGDRIIAIGTQQQVEQRIDHYDKIYDLAGNTVVPGFFESHDHLYLGSMTTLIPDISPFVTPTLKGAMEKLSHAQPDKDGWILAFGADQTLYKEKQGPTRAMLDQLFPNTPTLVIHLSGHGGFANSAALKHANIDETTPNPEGGYYEKDQQGQLTGYLSGQPALFSVRSYPTATVDSAMQSAKERAANGITTASEFALMDAFILEQVQQATQNPDFPVRMVGGLFSTKANMKMANTLNNYQTPLFNVPFIKTWTDGSIQGGTGDLTHGYHVASAGQGGKQGSQEFFNNQILEIFKLGLTPAIHANGDGAVDTALNAVEYARTTLGFEQTKQIRTQLIHVNYSRPEQVQRMVKLNVYPTYFPAHVYYFGDFHAAKSLGPDRIERLAAIKDGFEADLRPTFHNDPPVTPARPLHNMWISMKRTSSVGQVIGIDQALSAEQALQAMTINGAYQFYMEDVAGSLEVGKYADFVVLDLNPLKVDVDTIPSIKIKATVMGGKLVYSDIANYDRVQPPHQH